MSDKIIKLKEFVKEVTTGRDDSHGYGHMEKISQTALAILKKYGDADLVPPEDVEIVGWIHDVDDHKFDHDGKLHDKLVTFMKTAYPDKADWYIDIANRISFSKEVKNGKSDWDTKLGIRGIFIRDLVSDADKLDAIGLHGLKRVIMFNNEHNGGNMSTPDLAKVIVDHCGEKLLRLKDEFIRTKHGQEMAEPLHKEMLDIVSDQTKLYDFIDEFMGRKK